MGMYISRWVIRSFPVIWISLGKAPVRVSWGWCLHFCPSVVSNDAVGYTGTRFLQWLCELCFLTPLYSPVLMIWCQGTCFWANGRIIVTLDPEHLASFTFTPEHPSSLVTLVWLVFGKVDLSLGRLRERLTGKSRYLLQDRDTAVCLWHNIVLLEEILLWGEWCGGMEDSF